MDPALKGLLEECKGDPGVLRKIQTWSKPGGVFSMYLKHCIPLRLSDEQMVERDTSILRQRVGNRKKIDAKWQEIVAMKDIQIQVIKEDRDRGVGMYKDLHESSFASARGYEGRDKRWNAFIQNRMDFLEKFEEVHEQQLAELDDARSKQAFRRSGLQGGGERCDGIFEQEEEAQEEMGGRPEVYEVSCNGIRNK